MVNRPMSDRKAILARIRALRAKTAANGCTEPEVASAWAKARAIMATHQVSYAELVGGGHEPVPRPGRPSRSSGSWAGIGARLQAYAAAQKRVSKCPV